MKPKKTRQQEIDERAIREANAVGADNPGGQDKISTPRLKPRFKGITMHGDHEEENHA
jgi:hypothetical protein